jgi:putative nucleotidyltransferase with HDIG domain
VIQSFLENEILISRGNVITEADLETLGEFGLLEQIYTWEHYASVGLMVLINFVFIGLYMQYRQDLLEDLRGVIIMVIFFVIYLFSARYILPNHVVLPYLFPIASFGLLTSALVNPPFGRIMSIPTNSLELALYFLFTSMFGVLVLKNANRIIQFFWAGLAISAVGAAVIIAFRIGDNSTDYMGILTLVGAAIINGLGMQFILHNAPGTYQHSLLIANLSEQAAEKINASALLTRVGALYHDAGKALNPHFFIENKLPDAENPHESLSPLESSKIIIQHVIDGETLAKKHHLPKRVRSFITEHHGTLITRYQYHLAVERAKGDAGLVDESAFRYPGPAPQSVETMLVMLADACEARARAERPDDEAGLRKIIREIIDKRREEGQLDDVPVTMQELSIITESFTATLKGIYHPRIKYPTEEETEALSDEDHVFEEEQEVE